MSSSFRSWACALALCLFAMQAGAAGWEFEPRIIAEAMYDDNYRLSEIPGAEIDVAGVFLDAELGFRSETPRTVAQFRPRVRTSVFPDAESEESTDTFLGLGWQQRSQRLESRVELDYADESVVTSEVLPAIFPDVDLGDVVIGDGGRVSVRNRRELISAKPSVSYAWTPRHRIDAGLTYFDASYDENLLEQSGFRDLMLNGGITSEFSQRDSLSARLRLGTYEPDGARDDTERLGFEGEWVRRFSPTVRFYLRAGAETAETEVRVLDAQRLPVTMTVSDTSIIGGLGAAWSYQVTEILLDAVRSVAPSSAGVVVDRDELRLRMRRELRARLAVFGNMRGVRTQGSVEDLAGVRDREYFTTRLGLEWRMTRALRILGAVDYAWQEFENEPTDATSNAIVLTFIYEPRRRN
jgi:hypothetical protein